MAKLSDMQTILLSTAAQRPSHSLYPLPDTLKQGARVSNAITALINQGFAAEREIRESEEIHSIDGDIGYGVFATDAGLTAIGVVEETSDRETTGAATPAPRTSKTTAVIALLERDRGASLDELIEATGWLPHTTRAALTGLRKKGHVIERTKRDDHTCYRIAVSA